MLGRSRHNSDSFHSASPRRDGGEERRIARCWSVSTSASRFRLACPHAGHDKSLAKNSRVPEISLHISRSSARHVEESPTQLLSPERETVATDASIGTRRVGRFNVQNVDPFFRFIRVPYARSRGSYIDDAKSYLS